MSIIYVIKKLFHWHFTQNHDVNYCFFDRDYILKMITFFFTLLIRLLCNCLCKFTHMYPIN